MTSTEDSAESITRPRPESDLDDIQIRNMLASRVYLQEREASGDRSRVYRSFPEKVSVQFISLSRKCGGNLPQCSHTKESRGKKLEER